MYGPCVSMTQGAGGCARAGGITVPVANAASQSQLTPQAATGKPHPFIEQLPPFHFM
jgi:hypothetical protein